MSKLTLISTSIALCLSASLPAGTIQYAVEEPVANNTYSGVGNVRGYAVSTAGIERVELYVDGVFKTNIPWGGARKDVGNAYPSYPDSSQSGYSMAYGYMNLSDGNHTIKIKVVDNDGATKEKSIAFKSANFPGGYISDATQVDGTDADVSVKNNAIKIAGLMVEGQAYDVSLGFSKQNQSMVFSSIAASSGGGGGGGDCVTVPWLKSGTVTKHNISGSSTGTMEVTYKSVSKTGSTTDTKLDATSGGVKLVQSSATTTKYHVTDYMLYLEATDTTATTTVAGYNITNKIKSAYNPAYKTGAVEKFCLNQTWHSDSVTATITADGVAAPTQTPALDGIVESINDTITVPAGTFNTVRVKSSPSTGGYTLVWTDKVSGNMVRQRTYTSGGAQTDSYELASVK